MGLRGSLSLERKLVAVPARGAAPDGALGAPVATTETQDPSYFQKLVNLFPAEAVTLYGTGVAIFTNPGIGVIIVCLVVLVGLRLYATQPTGGGKPHYAAVAVAAVAFVLWATALDATWLTALSSGIDVADASKWASFLGAAFVFVAPLVLPPPPAPPAPPAT